MRWEECPSTSQAAIQNQMLVMAVKNPYAGGAARVGVASATPSGLAYLASVKVLNDHTVPVSTQLQRAAGRRPGPARRHGSSVSR